MDAMRKSDVIVLAAGRGARMKADKNKMFLPVESIPILYRTLSLLNSFASVNRIIIVLKPEEQEEVEQMITHYGRLGKISAMVAGGKERYDSVKNGLRHVLENPGADIVMVHDGARPFFSERMIKELNEAILDKEVAIPVLPIYETVRRKSENEKTETVDRKNLFAVQTPQAFHRNMIEEVFFSEQNSVVEPTDEASWFEQLGYDVVMIPGEKWNLKVTAREDLIWAKCLMENFPELEVNLEKQ